MFSSSFEVQPLVATPSPTVTNKQASPEAVSACTKKATNDDDTTPKIKHPKQQQQEQQQEPLAASTSTPPPLNVQDYVQNFTELASSSIDRAYGMERSIHQSPRTGRLSTCLPEDVFSLLDIQYHSILDFLQENGFATTATTTTASNSAILTVEGQGLLMGTLVFLLRQIQETQERFRPLILNSSSNRSSSRNSTNSVGIEECCAAANDFLLMSEKMEVFLERLQQRHDFLTLTNNNSSSSSSSKFNNPFEDDYRDDTNETTDTTTNSTTNTTMVQQASADLILRWSQDAVIAVERVQVVWMRHVHTQTYIATDLFSPCWEADWTNNDVVLDLLQNLHDVVLGPMEDYYLGGSDNDDDNRGDNPNQVLYEKALVACCRALVCFYLQCLVQKADAVRRGRRRNAGPAAALRRRTYQLASSNSGTTATDSSKNTESPFKYASRAVLRMTGDVQLIQEFFLEKTADSATLSRIVGEEMRILELVQECLTTTILPHRLHLEEMENDTVSTAAASAMTAVDGSTSTGGSYKNYCHADADSLESFILVIHKRIGADPLVTNMFMNDLWLLIAASSNTISYTDNKEIDQTISTVEQDLHMVSRGMQELGNSIHAGTAAAALSSGDVSFVRLDEMLKAIYEDRLVQGVLPMSICWNCLPKTPQGATTNANDEIVSQKIRTWTRNLTEVRRWKLSHRLKPTQLHNAHRHKDKAVTTMTKTAPEATNVTTTSTNALKKTMSMTTTKIASAAAETTSTTTNITSTLKMTMTTTTKTAAASEPTTTSASNATSTLKRTIMATATKAAAVTTRSSKAAAAATTTTKTIGQVKKKSQLSRTSLTFSSTAAEI